MVCAYEHAHRASLNIIWLRVSGEHVAVGRRATETARTITPLWHSNTRTAKTLGSATYSAGLSRRAPSRAPQAPYERSPTRAETTRGGERCV